MAEKILVVDDEFLSRDNLCKFLSSEGYQIRQASSGFEAIQLLATETFNLVITDFLMPDVDGLRLIELVNDKWPELPVILITGYLSVLAGEIILKGKAAAVFAKPIKLDDLLSDVRRILNPIRL